VTFRAVGLGIVLCALGAGAIGAAAVPRTATAARAEVAARARVARVRGTLLIYKGKAVPPGTYLAVVGLTRSGRIPVCSGTVIAPDIVLTAAHCMCVGARHDVFVGHDPNQRIAGGGYYRITGVKSAMACTNANLRTGRDLALVRVAGGMSEVTPVRLATAPWIDRASTFRIVGFGATDLTGLTSTHTKQYENVPAVSTDCRGTTAQGADAERYGCLPGQEIVAGRWKTPDTCRGDSGGPLLVSESGASAGAREDELALAGVTSRATRNAATTCGSGGIYERLTPESLAWIEAGMAELRSR
jgi:secreted trypsin-like serine protease